MCPKVEYENMREFKNLRNMVVRKYKVFISKKLCVIENEKNVNYQTQRRFKNRIQDMITDLEPFLQKIINVFLKHQHPAFASFVSKSVCVSVLHSLNRMDNIEWLMGSIVNYIYNVVYDILFDDHFSLLNDVKTFTCSVCERNVDFVSDDLLTFKPICLMCE